MAPKASSDPSREPSTSQSPPIDVEQRLTLVALGASAGGLEALEAFFDAMPDESGLSFVVVTHQHPEHSSLLPVLLSRHTRMPVTAAMDAATIEPNRVYVSPPGKSLALEGRRLRATDIERSEHARSPIDGFFRSLAEEQGERAICVILSGSGSDGTLGVRAVKGAAGMVMVQDEHSARYSGMPRSAAATQLADYVLPPAQMPATLIAYAGVSQALELSTAVDELSGMLPRIFNSLQSRTGHDFSGYRSSTIHRRVERRMKVHQIDSPREYLQLLQANGHEVDLLFKELLITVTSFFRDPEAFVSLEAALFQLFDQRPNGRGLRIWVPGCSTGEEAYSIALLAAEYEDRLGRGLDLQIFATDLDGHAVEIARAGCYPEGIAADVSAERLARFFKRDGDGYRINKEIRTRLVFAVQNVLSDPPFTKVDLVSCRNLLIYLNTDLQNRLFSLFHYALKPGGFLFLGTSETAAAHSELFEPVDRKWKLHQRKQTESRALTRLSLQPRANLKDRSALGMQSAGFSKVAAALDKVLLNRFAPPTVIVGEQGDIAYIHGRTGDYLEPSTGEPRSNVFAMAREGLRLSLSSAMRRATTDPCEVVHAGIRVRTNGAFSLVNLTVRRLTDPESVRGLFRVSFEPSPGNEASTPTLPDTQLEPAEVLEQELAHVKESLQASVEALQTSNEELKSTNEELQSTNEELQSANEELETSKEELQSLNEELQSVNAELRTSVDELSRVGNDMQNLLNSTGIATLVLDRELRIKRFTKQAQKLIRLIPSDVDRSLRDLVSDLDYPTMTEDAARVLETLEPHEVEVRSRSGNWILARIMPYLTAEGGIEGVVLTFVDFDRVKRAELLAKEHA